MNRRWMLPCYLLSVVLIIVLALLYMPVRKPFPNVGDGTTGEKGGKEGRDEKRGLLTGDLEASPVHKNETVYVLLDPAGEVSDVRVVNWVHDQEKDKAEKEHELLVDYGPYKSIRNMTSEKEPLLKDDMVVWDRENLRGGDIFYEGITDRELPVDISLTYYLDGARADPAELVGESGELEIVISIKNRLAADQGVYYEARGGETVFRGDGGLYVPLLVQGMYNIDLNSFSQVEAADAFKVVTGETINLGFTAFPFPEDEMVIKMKGENISLNPIMLTIIPGMPPLPEMDGEDELEEILGGISGVGNGLLRIHGSLRQIIWGLETLRSASQKILDEITGLQDLFAYFAGVMDEIFSDDFLQMVETINGLFSAEMLDRLREALEVADHLDRYQNEIAALNLETGEAALAVDDFNRSLARFSEQNEYLAREARRLMEDGGGESEWFALASLVLAREDSAQELAGDGYTLQTSISALHNSLHELGGEGGGGLPPDWGEVLEALEALLDYEDTLQRSGFFQRDWSELFSRAEELKGRWEQLETTFHELLGLPLFLHDLINGLEQISGAIEALHDQGIRPLESGLVEAIDEIRFGKAKIALMEKLAENYRSFVNNRRNVNSRVQFLLQVEEISGPDRREGIEPGITQSTGIWQRIMALFTGLSGIFHGS